MKWIYYISSNTNYYHEKGTETASSKVYFRPVMIDEKGELLGGNMVILNILALENLFESEEQIAKNNEKINKIYFEDLAEKNFKIEQNEVPESHKDYLLQYAYLFLKQKSLSKEAIIQWVRDYLAIEGMPCEELESATYNDFADENPVMRMFSAAAKKGEEKFGKDWWKKDDKK